MRLELVQNQHRVVLRENLVFFLVLCFSGIGGELPTATSE